MASILMKISDLFNGKRLLRIPPYQRGYAWQKEQWQDLWDDLDGLLEHKKHYTGLLTLAKAEHYQTNAVEQAWLAHESDRAVYYLVDGQQRLTTLLIMMSLLTELGVLSLAEEHQYLQTTDSLALFDYEIHKTTQELHDTWHSILQSRELPTSYESLYAKICWRLGNFS